MKISIITVTYNAAATLERTLESVAVQSFEDKEHIIVDGASSDGTIEMIDAYRMRTKDYSVLTISERDKGLYDAMNKGLEMAHGDFVVFLNAGDCLHDADVLKSLEARVESAESEVGVIYGDTDLVDIDQKRIGPRRLSPPERLTWKSFRRGMLVCHQSFYARRELCPKYDLRYRFSADVDWCIRVMKASEARGMSLIYINKVLTDYLDEGMTTKNHKASLLERFDVMKRHYGLATTIAMHVWFAVRGFLRLP